MRSLSRAASFRAKIEQRDTELSGLVREVVGDTRAWEHHDPDWHRLEQYVVALERRGVLVPVEVGLEGDLWHLALIGPAGGDSLGPLRRSAM